ncbi:DNA polymerase I [Dongia soli]|uniref:DNA polymerase I n=1 Tax=Dongia soli TaxID=600628 RepID=A0ABU5E6I1_9PROT|nr:DNA polymerase I [Dongia soli]MDY0881497.1 DNA polymerase I [Dongia soli]
MPQAAPAIAPGEKPQHVYLVDGSGYIFRAFHALPPLTRPDGTPVGAVLGFTNMLMKLLDETDADHIAVIFDAARRNFRNEIYADYKGHRPEPPPELIPQFGLIHEATRAFNVPAIQMEGFEADDLIATYAEQAVAAGADVTIVSSDKDLMQLVNDKVRMFDPMKNRPIGAAEVMEKFGVTPDKVVDVQALAGDSIDNVPGVPGIGVKTAAELINTYGDLDTLLAKAGEIKQPKRRDNLIQNADKARISRDLVCLKRDVPVDVPLADFVRRKLDLTVLLDFLKTNEFRTTINRVQSRHGKSLAAQNLEAAPGKAPDVVTSPNLVTTNPAAVTAATTFAAPAAVDAVSVPFDPANYQLVQDIESLQLWVEAAMQAGQVVVDTETTSLQTQRADLVGISMALEPGRACYIPLGHGSGGDLLDAGEKPQQIPMDVALKTLKPLLEDPAVLKIGQNIKYDLCIFSTQGIKVAPVDDTMLISYVLEGGAHGHGMDELSELHLGHKPIAYSEVTGTGKAQITFDKVPLDKALAYAAEDADVTLRLHRLLKPRLLQEHLLTVYESIERPLIPAIAQMECVGVKIDAPELQRLSADFAGRMAELEREIRELAGIDFNIGSPKQLGEVLFDHLKLPGGKKGKTGAYATGADVLEELATTSGHPVPKKVLDWRQLSKLKSTYTDALQNEINPKTGRVHTSFALAATTTGRLSSSEPNLQNIPIRTEEGRKIRRAFIAEKGMKLLSVDYSQIELRLAAEMADIPALQEAFRKGEDIHALTASQVFGIPIEGMDPMVRRRAKAINFGIIYGISAFGLSQQLGIPQGEAKAYIEAYFKRYPGIREYMERTKDFARKHGYVTTLFGRRCYMPGIADKNPARRAFMERAAINAPLQGTAADIIKRAMARLPDALDRAGLKARMLLQVHDELLFEVPEAEVEATAALVKQVMEDAPKPAREISVPLIAETGVGNNWAEAH